jgi:SAM-dependent methyltransferase
LPEAAPPWLAGLPAPLRPALADHLAGTISAPVALMRLLLTGVPAGALLAALAELPPEAARRLAGLLALARGHAGGLAVLERMVRAGAEHGPAASAEAGIAASRAMFDRLVGISPEASVAAYSLGDPALLDQATREILDWLRGLGLLRGRPEVLDLGCGIGRMAAALAPEAGGVLGLDLSPRMVEAARQRCAGLAGLEFRTCTGQDLAPLGAAGFDLVLAVDVFPYLAQAGLALAERHIREAARVLRPGGSLVILNFSYRGLETDRADLTRLAAQAGFDLLRNGTRELRLWDAAAFWLRRPPAGRPAERCRKDARG